MSIVDAILGRNGDDPTAETDEVPPISLDKDELFTALSSPRRRFIIDYVGSCNPGEETTIGDLAEGLAYIENDDVDDIAEVRNQQRRRCYISLYQTHLPNLDRVGIVDYDDREGTVRSTPTAGLAQDVMLSAEQALAGRVGDSA